MSGFSTAAIMLRRVDLGDYDLIITFLTLNQGKISILAKSAKKSTKRFSGILELFYVLQVVCSTGPKQRLPILQEASLKKPFSRIRTDIIKTAYASYWAELINAWIEEKEKQVQLYRLFEYVLEELDLGCIPSEVLSILFQIRFMKMSGFTPNLSHCNICKVGIENMAPNQISFDVGKGAIVCETCASAAARRVRLSKGTIKQLLWIERSDLKKASRIRFTPQGLREGLTLLETFVPYHIGKEPRSLTFLRQIRK
ncbi:MAG: DNA repair protein RecO [Desulfobacterales bacterium]|nr:DNA repair protein RecO [Desulfobacterales bacterium]